MKNWVMGGAKNAKVMDNLDYAIETGEYSSKISCYKTQLRVWGDNDTKGYMLDHQHCPEELQAELKDQGAWAVIDNARSVVQLLILIQTLQYNKLDQSIMATVEADFDLYSCAQGRATTDKYYKMFTSTVDTINANGGNAGLHPSVFKKYFQPLKDRAVEGTGKDLAELTAAEIDTIKTEATTAAKEAVQGEYLACLFLLLADDERYGPLKT